MGRRLDQLAEVKAECWRLRDPKVEEVDITPADTLKPYDYVIALKADFADVEDMVRVREALKLGRFA